jgi:Ca2+-binding EF-hand superfamily protein
MKTSLCVIALAATVAVSAFAGGGSHGDAPRDTMRADKDGDGRVSRAEALSAAEAQTSEWFDKLDLNKDGFVTQEEIQQSRDTRRGQMKEMFDERFTEADVNKDGQLSLDEVQQNMPRLADRFSMLDKDKNGMLSRDELQRGGPSRQPSPEPAS